MLAKFHLIRAYGIFFLLCGSLTASLTAEAHSESRIDNRTVMVHLFEWKWTDIAKECTEFLGPKGFAAIQVSPPNEHALVEGAPWYQRYQPVSYKLESRSGTRDEFAQMVKTCKKAGVDIYVDAVINHMTGVLGENEKKFGSAGTPYGRYLYKDFSYDDFHHCGRNGNDTIQNYGDRWEVQNCELVSLTDLNTSSPTVQNKIAGYLQDVMDLGVAGFRIDAAKHMAASDIQKILQATHRSPYIYQEVIDQGGEPISAAEYFENGDVTEFRYGQDVSRIFREGKIAWFNGEKQLGPAWNYMPSDKAIVFIDNHDNQRGHGGAGHVLTHKERQKYELAAIFMMAWPYGYPQLMSSYAFSDSSQGPPSQMTDCLSPEQAATAKTGWICEHRWPSLAAMVEFRNVTSSEFYISNWWTNGNNAIAFGRGRAGFTVINNEDFAIEQDFSTALPAGKYCDIIGGIGTQGQCRGKSVQIDENGKFRSTVPAHSALALHIGKRLN